MNKPTRYFSTKQEERLAKKFNGKKVVNSGATKFRKGDVIISNMLVECKTCTEPKTSFSIKKEWLEKAKKEAFEMGYSESILAIDFGSSEDYFVIDERLFKLLLEVLINEK